MEDCLPAEDMPARIALIVANGEFRDSNLSKLVKPSGDAKALAEVLGDSELGDFQVTTLVDKTAQVLRSQIARLYKGRKRGDLLLLYYSGHGIRDEQSGELYLATNDTELEIPSAASIEAAWVRRLLDKCDSSRKVVILDCCHAGAFPEGAKAMTGGSAGTYDAFKGSGFGRVILTASNAIEYALEGDAVRGKARPSVFTRHLVEGLRTGKADRDNDGKISLDELYSYVNEKVKTSGESGQTPQKWSQKVEGEITLAKNPHPVIKPAELGADLQESIADSRHFVRKAAVDELAREVRGKDLGVALAALQALQGMTEDDSRSVSSSAAHALEKISEAPDLDPRLGEVIGIQGPPEPEKPPEISRRALREAMIAHRRGQQHMNRRDYTEARPFYDLAIKYDPGEAQYYSDRGSLRLRVGDVKGAIADLSSAIRLEPENPKLRYRRSVLYGRREEHRLAIDDLEHAIKLRPSRSDYYLERGKNYYGAGKGDLALADFEEAIRLDPSNGECYYGRGKTYLWSKQDARQAILDFTKAIKRSRGTAKYYRGRGLARKKLGHIEAARNDLKRASDLGDSEARKALTTL